MSIHGESSLSRMDLATWRSAASEHLESDNRIFGGRNYVFLKGADKIAVFDSKVQESGYSKMSYPQLIQITMQKMKECSNAQEVKATRGILESLIGRVSQQSTTGKENEISKVASQTISEAKAYLESTKPTLDVISADRKGPLTAVLTQATGVSRSVHGRGGIYYPDMKNRTPETPLFKIPTQGGTPQDSDPRRHIVADRIYSSIFGVTVSNYGLVHRESDQGSQVLAFIKKNGEEFYESEPSLSAQKAKFDHELSKTDYILVMDEIKGTTFTQAEKDDQRALLKDGKFLESVGEMIFIDAVIGNFDRMGVMPDATAAPLINLGNMMVLREGESDSKGRRIALIDHDFNLSRDNFVDIERNIRRLANSDDDLLKQLAKGLHEEVYAGAPSKDAIEKLEIPIRVGFEKAMRQFIDKFDFNDEDTVGKKKEMLKNLFDFPNDPKASKI